MKKLICLVAVLMLCIAFSACGESTNTSNSQVTLTPIENLSEYVVVRGDTCSSEEKVIATSLRETINNAIDASIAIKTDYTNSKYEILVGKTKRQQSIDAIESLRYYDYTIKKVGNKIVIAGGSNESLKKAVDLFTKQFIDNENKTIKVPTGEGYTYIATYATDKLTIDGVDFSEFKLVNKSVDDPEAFATTLRKISGTNVDIYDKTMVDDEHYIILMGTELIEHKFSITIEEGNVIIKGSANSLPKAVEYFANELVKDANFVITSANNYEGSTGKKETYTKEQLGKVIQQLYDNPFVIAMGEEAQGNKDPYAIENSINIFYEETAQMPAIVGIDLGCYGIDLTKIDDIYLSSYICDIVDFVSAGGMITASAHWDNPSDPSRRVRGNLGTVNTLEGYEQAFTDLLTEGTEYNNFFKAELEIEARFFKALEENGVPLIWRPLHEANGDWFWYCIGQKDFWLDANYVIDIWHYIYDYFENECGLTNLYWIYAPNTSQNIEDTPSTLWVARSTTYLYPGDEYCDMVGVDWYESGNLGITANDNYLRLIDTARKPGAITEFGPSGDLIAANISDQPSLYNCMDMYGTLFDLVKDGYSFVYLLTWGEKWSVAAMKQGEEMMNTDLCIGLTEVSAMFDALK